jgi:hypothetical protein
MEEWKVLGWKVGRMEENDALFPSILLFSEHRL